MFWCIKWLWRGFDIILELTYFCLFFSQVRVWLYQHFIATLSIYEFWVLFKCYMKSLGFEPFFHWRWNIYMGMFINVLQNLLHFLVHLRYHCIHQRQKFKLCIPPLILPFVTSIKVRVITFFYYILFLFLSVVKLYHIYT